MSESATLMDGHKMDLFILDLSFIGWWIVAAITCGIGALWVAPYVSVTTTNFYLDIKK